jgi:hypothetical protein
MIAEIGVYALLYMAVGAVKAVGKIRGWMREGEEKGERSQQSCSLEELGKRKEALKQRMFDEIASELGRVGSGGGTREELREELESLKKSVNQRLDKDAEASVVDELNALKRKICAVELDEAQCRSRTESIERLFEALRTVPAYTGELRRLEGEFERISALPVEERMWELQGILEELREMEKLAKAAAEADIDNLEEHRYAPHEAERRRIVLEIRDFADRVAQLDEIEGEKLRPLLEGLNPDSPFPDRLVRLRERVKTTWGALREKNASTAFFREKLLELLEILQASEDAASSQDGSELIRRCDGACGGKFIDRELFMTLYEDISRFVWSRREEIGDALFAQKVEETLSELGYEMLTDDLPAETEAGSERRAVRVLESPYEGYRVMAKVDSKGVTARLVRVAADEGEEKNAPAAHQRQKDLETGKKWCRDLDVFLEKMSQQGLPLDVTLRKEPEESELLIVVDKTDKTDKTAPARKKKRKKGEGLKERARERAIRGEGAETP